DRPVEKIRARIVRKAIDVEDIYDAEFSYGHDHAIVAARAAQLVRIRLCRLLCARQIECLPDECPLQPQVRLILADLISLAARKTGDTQGVIEAVSLIELAVQPTLRAAPQSGADVERGVGRFRADVRRQAVGAAVRSIEPAGFLFHVSELTVEGKDLLIGGRRRGQRQQHQASDQETHRARAMNSAPRMTNSAAAP